LPDPASNPAPLKPRRWTIIAAGFLLLALALVVLYTSSSAFSSPLALVVVAAIGFAALLLQLRLRPTSVHAPFWLNVLAVLFALAAVIADFLHLSFTLMFIVALGAIVCFGISGIVVLRALRKH
jgi:drug/metabolite transporter (DMT)-like permease